MTSPQVKVETPILGSTATIMPPTESSAPPTAWDRMTRTLAHYERIEQIGEGTYGQVYRAKCLDTGRIVAMKKIRVHHGAILGMPPTVLREIKILRRLRHRNLVEMLEVVSSKGVEYLDENDPPPEEKGRPSKKDKVVDAREGYKGNIYLVLEYLSHDLTGLMDVAFKFTELQIKCIFRQLLEALEYMHENKYVHRDIKSSNILIDSNFRVKLADFGLARCIEPPILDTFTDRGAQLDMTNKIVTLWYRPPEILLGATRYGCPVDIWSAGCILAELLLGKPLFTGKSEMDQLQQIFELLGTPSKETFEGLYDLKLLRTGEVTIDQERQPKLRSKYASRLPGPALNLLEKLLELDPQKRLTASRALTSRYFLAEPRAPDDPAELGVLQLGEGGGHFHEFQTKKKRREAKAVAKKASEEAKAMGLSEKDAEAEYDAVYRECMKKVAEEGNAALRVATLKKIDGEPPPKAKEQESRRDASQANGGVVDKMNAEQEGMRKDDQDGSHGRDDRKEKSDRKRRRDEEPDRRHRSRSKEGRHEGERRDFEDHSDELFRRGAGRDDDYDKEERRRGDRERNSRDRRSSRDSSGERTRDRGTSRERGASRERHRKSSHRDRESSRRSERDRRDSDHKRHRKGDRERRDRDKHKADDRSRYRDDRTSRSEERMYRDVPPTEHGFSRDQYGPTGRQGERVGPPPRHLYGEPPPPPGRFPPQDSFGPPGRGPPLPPGHRDDRRAGGPDFRRQQERPPPRR